MFNEVMTGPQNASGDGVVVKARSGRTADQIVSQLQGKYYENAVRGNLFQAHAIVTAPVIYTTAAGTGGPLLWNNTTTHNAVILALGMSSSVVTTVAAGLGITGNTGQTAAPTTTTAIDSNVNLLLGGAGTRMNLYRIGTVSTAGGFFIPLWQVHTGALTADTTGTQWVDLGGCIVVPPRGWASVAASATATTLVANFGMIYAEVPIL